MLPSHSSGPDSLPLDKIDETGNVLKYLANHQGSTRGPDDWPSWHHLTATTAMGWTRAFSYNGDGTLVSQTADGTLTTYTRDLAGGLSQVLASTSGSTTTDYLCGQDRLASLVGGLRTWYGTDGQGY